MKLESLTHAVIGCALEVHRELGPGLLESTYQACLAHELSHAGMSFALQLELPVNYKGIQVDCGYRMDVLVEKQLVLELKAVDQLLGVFTRRRSSLTLNCPSRQSDC